MHYNIQHNDIKHNKTQHNDTLHNTHNNDNERNRNNQLGNTHGKIYQYDPTQYSNIQHYGTKQNDSQCRSLKWPTMLLVG